jgi:DNA (cytosine-5)-methyltransferase 1
MGLDEVLSDLESEGYSAEAIVIPACAVDAHHRRDRVWIVGNTEHDGLSASEVRGINDENGDYHTQGEVEAVESARASGRGRHENVANSNSKRGRSRNASGEYAEDARQRSKAERDNAGGVGRWDAEPAVGRVANGVSGRVDRLKGLGNAIVPQVAAEILRVMMTVDNLNNEI